MMDLIFIIGGVLVLLSFLFSLAVIHLRSVRDDVNNRWYNLAEKLQYRQDLLPNLIETVRQFVPAEELQKNTELINKVIEERSVAAKNTNSGSEKMIQEHDLNVSIEELFKLGEKFEELGKSTNYLELKKEFKDINTQTEDLIKDYNNRIRSYNSILARPYNIPAALIMKYRKKLIFNL